MAMCPLAIGAMLLGCEPGTATVRSSSPFGENHLSSALARSHTSSSSVPRRVSSQIACGCLQVLRRTCRRRRTSAMYFHSGSKWWM